jgi:hypothetical protein
MASRPRLPRTYRVGDRVVTSGWRDNVAWEGEVVVVHTYVSAIDGPIVVVVTDAPEPDGAAMFDLPTTDVEAPPAAPQGSKR